MKNYIIQDIETGLYYGGDNYGWCDIMRMADTFENKEDAERFARGENDGWYKIEEIYIVGSQYYTQQFVYALLRIEIEKL